MNELLLVVKIGGQRAAFRAALIRSVIELDALTPIPRAPAFVAGLAALRSRVLTVIDCARSLELGCSATSPAGCKVAVIEHDGHFYGLMVDMVEDVIEALSDPLPLRTSPGSGWDRVSPGMVETELGALLLADIAEIIAGPQKRLAA